VSAGPYLREYGEVAYEYDFGGGWKHTVRLRG